MKVIFQEADGDDEDWAVVDQLKKTDDICPIIKTREQLQQEEFNHIRNYTEQELVHMQMSKLQNDQAKGLEKEKTKPFINRIVVNLKSGYDMPIDPLNNFMLMPSVFCEFGYSKDKGLHNVINS